MPTTRPLHRVVLLLVAALAGPCPATAADVPKDPIAAAFVAWTARWKIPAATAVVTRDGTRGATVSVGFRRPAMPALVGSLSKAVTGLCVERLVEAGRLSYDGTLATLIPGFFARHPAKDARMTAITVAELALHTSAIALDPTQGATDAAIDPTRSADETILAAALKAPLKGTPGRRFAYNNANYAALALVIEAVTGEDYGRACGRLVLKPVGVSGGLSEDWRIMSAFGGWRMSPAAYSRLLAYFEPGSGLLKRGPEAWPAVDLGGGLAYSLGIIREKRADGRVDIWHDGAIEAALPGTSVSVGAFFAVYGGKAAVVAGFQPLPSEAAQLDLRTRLAAAAAKADR